MKITEYFDSQKRESKKLADALQAHMATSPAMHEQYDTVDVDCITLASRLNAERLAGSPRAISTEADLILLRRKRDGVKHVWHLKRDELHRKIEILTRPLINETSERWLEEARSLPNKYIYQSDRIIDSNGRFRTFRISHNGDVLIEAKNRILSARKQLFEMLHCSIAEIEEAISKREYDFAMFDLSVLQIEEVSSHDAARALAPSKETPDLQESAYKYSGAPPVVVSKNNPKLQDLSARISKLEGGL